MKTKILIVTMAIFLGCVNAADSDSDGVDAGKYFRNKDATPEEFVKLFTEPEATPRQMCSKGGNIGKKTLRSFDGKFCNDKTVCTLLRDKCFPNGADPYGAKESSCHKTCKTTQKDLFLTESSNSAAPNKTPPEAVYERNGLDPSASCEDIKKKRQELISRSKIQALGKQGNIAASFLGGKQKVGDEGQINMDFETINTHAGCGK